MSKSRSYSNCGPLPAQVVSLLANAEEIAQACARTVFASQWGDAVERAKVVAKLYPASEESAEDAAPQGYKLPNLSGVDLCEVAPFDQAPPRFLQFARDAVAQLVAAAFEDRDGAEALERWRDADAAELGRVLALTVLATGAGEWEHESDSELAPRMDCDGRLYLSLSEVWEPDEPTDDALGRLTPRELRLLDPSDVRNAPPTAEQRAQFVAALRATMNEHTDARDALKSVSDLLRAHGVESLELPDDSGTRLYYVNRGDTYDDTLTWNGSRFRVESWGGALEAAEEVRTQTTGEQRCGYCSNWSLEVARGKPCPSCGHAD